MNNIKLIACDLDGTLLLNGAQKCDASLFPLITQLKEENIIFCAASGRQYHSLNKLFEPVKEDLLYICENGMQIIYKDKILFEETLDYELAMKICKEISKYDDCEIMISLSHTSCVLNRNANFIKYLKEEVRNEVTIINSIDEIKDKILKIALYVPADQLNMVNEKLSDLFSCDCQVLTSGHIWIDFVPFNIDKGSAILKICELFNLSLNDIAAFGDNENDRTMLEKVKYAYLMKSCNPTMKTLNNEYIECEKVELSLQEIINKRRT